MALDLLIALALTSAPVASPAGPEAAAAAFVDAFRAMDEGRFDTFFAPEVTMFFPDGPFPRDRVNGREAVLSAFHSFFARMRERGRARLNIAPVDQLIQHHGDVAIVSFKLDSDGAVGRRSIILRRIGGQWRIVHFHASTIEN